MGRLTTLGASDRLHVFRPAPTRLKRRLTNNPVAYLDDVYPSLVRHWANLVGRVKALLFWLSHGFVSSVLGLVEAILAPLVFLTAPWTASLAYVRACTTRSGRPLALRAEARHGLQTPARDTFLTDGVGD